MEKFGIEGLKAQLKLIFAGKQAYIAAEADGKIDLMDVPLLIPVIGPAQEAYRLRLQVGNELSDLSVAEAGELVGMVAAELGGIQEITRARVQAILDALVANYKVYKLFKDAPAPAAA